MTSSINHQTDYDLKMFFNDYQNPKAVFSTLFIFNLTVFQQEKLEAILESISVSGCTVIKIRKAIDKQDCMHFLLKMSYLLLVYQHPFRDHIMLEYGMYVLHGDNTSSGALFKRSNRHRLMLCPVLRGDSMCEFEAEGRLRSGITFLCPFLRKTSITDSSQPLLQAYLSSKAKRNPQSYPGVLLTPIKQETTRALLTTLASTSLKFIDVDRQCFRAFCQTLIQIRQQHPGDPLESLAPEMDRHVISDMLCQLSVDALDSLFSAIANTIVSIQFDAATINHKQLMLITVVSLAAPNNRQQTFQLGRSPATLPDYLAFLANIFQCLNQNRTTIGNICTDGCPVQRAAIFQYLRTLRIPSFNQPLLIPNVVWCHNHLLNLICQHLGNNQITESSTVKMTRKIRHFTTLAHHKTVKSHLHAICPTFIPPRWLSLWFIQSFIRLHRATIIRNNYLSEHSLKRIVQYEVLITPVIELQLFFENENTRLMHVLPAILRTIQQYVLVASQPLFSSGEWLLATAYVLHLLFCRFFRSTIYSDAEIHKALIAFALTPIGQRLFQCGAFISGFALDKGLETVRELLYALSSYF